MKVKKANGDSLPSLHFIRLQKKIYLIVATFSRSFGSILFFFFFTYLLKEKGLPTLDDNRMLSLVQCKEI